MGNNGHNKTSIINPDLKKYDLTDPDNYEGDYPVGGFNNVVKDIYELPGTDDMAGVLLRGRIKDERQLNAILRLYYRHEKFNDQQHKQLLRMKIAGTAAIGGVRSLEALFGSIQMLASDMYRAVLRLPKLKKNEEEKVYKGSDFRRNETQPPDKLGGQP